MSSRLRATLILSASALAFAPTAFAQGRDGYFVDGPPAVSTPAPAPAAADLKTAPAPQAPRPEAFASGVIKPVETEGGGPDETALRYYAAQNQTARVNVEIGRLKKLYPNWVPPENLYEAVSSGGEDEQALWDLYSADRIDDLQKAIAERQRDEPGWRPSDDLSRKMHRKALRLKLMGFWKDGRITDFLDAVKADGFGGDAADLDLQWTVAEAYSKSRQIDEAVNVYKAILNTSTERQDRVATLQKAMDSLRISEVEPLIAMGRVDAAGRSEFAQLSIDITRLRISAFLHDERPEPIPDAEFRAFEDYARGVKQADQIGLVAWYHYKTKAFRDSLEWFKLALERGGDAMIAHGLAHSLRELGMKLETEEVAYAWREPLINNGILFIDVLERDLTKPVPPYIEPERLLRYGQVTMDMASGEGAQALGWYAYNTCQFEAAYAWFQHAAAWFPKEATVYGLALSARRAKKGKEFWEVVNRYDGLFPKVLEIVFPDGYEHPPTPCDIVASGAARKGQPAAPVWTPPATMAAPGVAGTRFAAQPPYQQNLRNLAPFAPSSPYAATNPYAASPYRPGGMGLQPLGPERDKMPKFAKGEFPASVDPENPLRASASGKLMGRPAIVPPNPAAAAPGAAPEPWRQAQPLVARRTPGVGPMPYERWGFALLPGENGLQTADAPHSGQSAPPGTAWAQEQTSGTQVNRVGAEGSVVDPYQALQAIAGAPRVPMPAAARLAPSSPFMRSTSLTRARKIVEALRLRPALPDEGEAGAARSDFASLGLRGAMDGVDDTPIGSIAGSQPPLQPVFSFDQTTSVVRANRVTEDLGKQAVKLYEQRKYQAALEALDLRGSMAHETPDLRLVRGWALMNLNRVEEARRVFGALGDRSRLRPLTSLSEETPK